MRILAELLGAAIGAAALWLAVPLFILIMSAARFFFEAYFTVVLFAFPLFLLISAVIAYKDYKKRKSLRKF